MRAERIQTETDFKRRALRRETRGVHVRNLGNDVEVTGFCRIDVVETVSSTENILTTTKEDELTRTEAVVLTDRSHELTEVNVSETFHTANHSVGGTNRITGKVLHVLRDNGVVSAELRRGSEQHVDTICAARSEAATIDASAESRHTIDRVVGRVFRGGSVHWLVEKQTDRGAINATGRDEIERQRRHSEYTSCAGDRVRRTRDLHRVLRAIVRCCHDREIIP